MRRNRNSRPHLLILAAAVAVAIFAATFLFRGEMKPFRTAPELNVADYQANSNSLRGNVYRIEGEVDAQLAWSPTLGRLVSVKVDGGKNALAILVTKKFDRDNIQKGQKYIFLLEVDANGTLCTKELTKY